MEKVKSLAAGSVLSGKTNQYRVERMLCCGGCEDATYIATTTATVGEASVRVMVAVKVGGVDVAEDVAVIERFSDEDGVTYTVTEYVEPRRERTSPWPIVAIVCGLVLVVSVLVFSEYTRREKSTPSSSDSVKVEQPIAPAADMKPAVEAKKAEPKKAEPKKEVAKEPVKETPKEKAKENKEKKEDKENKEANKESKKKANGDAKKGDPKASESKAKDKQNKSDTKAAAPAKEKAKEKTTRNDANAKAK